MKWPRVLEEPVDLDVAPWLVIRYRNGMWPSDKSPFPPSASWRCRCRLTGPAFGGPAFSD